MGDPSLSAMDTAKQGIVSVFTTVYYQPLPVSSSPDSPYRDKMSDSGRSQLMNNGSACTVEFVFI